MFHRRRHPIGEGLAQRAAFPFVPQIYEAARQGVPPFVGDYIQRHAQGQFVPVGEAIGESDGLSAPECVVQRARFDGSAAKLPRLYGKIQMGDGEHGDAAAVVAIPPENAFEVVMHGLRVAVRIHRRPIQGRCIGRLMNNLAVLAARRRVGQELQGADGCIRREACAAAAGVVQVNAPADAGDIQIVEALRAAVADVYWLLAGGGHLLAGGGGGGVDRHRRVETAGVEPRHFQGDFAASRRL